MRGSETNRRPPPGSGTGLAAVVPPRFTTVSRRQPCVSADRDVAGITGARPAMPTGRSAFGMRGRRRVGTRQLRRTLARLGSRLGGHVRTGCRRRHHTSRGSLSRQWAVYSSSSSPWVPAPERRNTKPPRNVVVDVHIAHLAGCSPAGIGTRRRDAGCRASKGRFPPPLWMSAGLHSVVEGDDSRSGGRVSSVLWRSETKLKRR